MKPQKTLLRNEILRRQEVYLGKGDCKVPHAQKSKLIHEQWHTNTRMSDTNKDFVVRNFNCLLRNVTGDAAGPSENDPDKLIQFCGMYWILRMIHCLVENDFLLASHTPRCTIP